MKKITVSCENFNTLKSLKKGEKIAVSYRYHNAVKDDEILIQIVEPKITTFREKLAMEHPDLVNEKYSGGCNGCPCDYGYESNNLCPQQGMSCATCWDREIPEDKTVLKDDFKNVTEMIDHPTHYNTGKREVIEEMRLMFGDEAVAAFCKLNAYKYMRRADHKGHKEEDLKKAEWYMDYLEKMGGEVNE